MTKVYHIHFSNYIVHKYDIFTNASITVMQETKIKKTLVHRDDSKVCSHINDTATYPALLLWGKIIDPSRKRRWL